MENLTRQAEIILKGVEENKSEFSQILLFEETIKTLESVVELRKPEYSLPMVDTLGKQTYRSLSKT